MTLPPPKVCKRIRKLHAQIGSSGKDADVAKQKLSQLLSEHGLTWNDLPTFFAAIEPGGAADSSNDAPTSGTVPAAARPEPHVLAVVLRLIEEHIAVTAEECLAVALWILHAHVFDRFSTTPRLALSSPVRGCGKTTVLTLIELSTQRPSPSPNSEIRIVRSRQPNPLAFIMFDWVLGAD